MLLQPGAEVRLLTVLVRLLIVLELRMVALRLGRAGIAGNRQCQDKTRKYTTNELPGQGGRLVLFPACHGSFL